MSRRDIIVPRRGILTNDTGGPSFYIQGATNVLSREPTRCLHTWMARGRKANLPLINGPYGYLCHSGIGKNQGRMIMELTPTASHPPLLARSLLAPAVGKDNLSLSPLFSHSPNGRKGAIHNHRPECFEQERVPSYKVQR